MKKQFWEEIKGLFFALLPWILIVLLLAVAFFIAYQISVSDLPPWFKFFLLQRG